MWSDLRSAAALRELEALRELDADVNELHAQALAVVARVVPFDAACIGAVDPETLLLTSGVTMGFSPSSAESERFVEIEYGGLDRNTFAALVDRRVPVLADAGEVTPARRRDVRFNELAKLIGFAHDVRIAFVADGSCWAVGDLYREGSTAGFERRELQFLERAATLLAAATRTVVAQGRTDADALPHGSAVMIVEGDGTISAMTSAAQAWIEAEQARGDGSRLWWAIRAAVTAARRGIPTASTRVKVGPRWVVVRASLLRSAAASLNVAVTIDEASLHDLADVLMAAHGMSGREREICHEVMAGRSTKEIAAALYISPHTVQDHLKSIFDKAGVRSRRELVAALGG